MTFWPRFAVSRNDLGNFVEIGDMFTLRPAPSTEFRRGSCCSSQIGWGPNICKVLPGCVITHSKIPQEYTNTGCGWDGLGRVGMGGDGWGWVGMGWDEGSGSVSWVRMGARMGWERQLWPRNGLVHLPASFFSQF